MNFNQFYFESMWDPVRHLYEIIKSSLIIWNNYFEIIIIAVSSWSHQI